MEGFPATISEKFRTEVKEWLRYKMAKKYYRTEYGARTLQTTDGFAIAKT